MGPAGDDGTDGADSPPGLAQYAYVYNTGAQSVALEAAILFDRDGVTTTGITHAPNAAGVVIATDGAYRVAFSVSSVEPSQFTLFVNNAPVEGTTYGSGAGTQQNTGQAILALQANDVLTVVNHTSPAAVTLQTLGGGTQTTTNASLVVEKLGELPVQP